MQPEKPKVPSPIIDIAVERVGEPILAPPKIKRSLFRDRLAMGVAILIDALQIGLFPLFAPGIASPFTDALDAIAFVFFWKVLGWHFALLPGFLTEMIPLIDLAPTWTIAVAVVIRSKQKTRQ